MNHLKFFIPIFNYLKDLRKPENLRVRMLVLWGSIFAMLAFQGRAPFPRNDPAFLVVLGIAQDAGYPQAGCLKSCCSAAWSEPAVRRSPVCLGLVDPQAATYWIVEASPDFPEQLREMQVRFPDFTFGGLLITHAHIGHYAGLMQLGREVMGASGIPVYVLPRMRSFLEENGPWSQLVQLGNIRLVTLSDGHPFDLSPSLTVTPFRVPHRDEFSETTGFWIAGPNRRVLFIPDINKWRDWEVDIDSLVGESDRAFLDGTFFHSDELPGRDMEEIPHPFIEESLQRFRYLPDVDRKKICFIHFNHTNPVLFNPLARKQVLDAGFCLAEMNQQEPL